MKNKRNDLVQAERMNPESKNSLMEIILFERQNEAINLADDYKNKIKEITIDQYSGEPLILYTEIRKEIRKLFDEFDEHLNEIANRYSDLLSEYNPTNYKQYCFEYHYEYDGFYGVPLTVVRDEFEYFYSYKICYFFESILDENTPNHG